MVYPKPIMSITELLPLGFSRDELRAACHAADQDFAVKTIGGGKFQIDTEKFEAWRQAKLAKEKAKHRYICRAERRIRDAKEAAVPAD